MRRLPVDSSDTNLSRKAPRPISSMRSSTVQATSSSDSCMAGRASSGGEVVADLEVALEADGDVLGHGEAREDLGVLEAAAEAEGGPPVGTPAGDVLAVEQDPAPASG